MSIPVRRRAREEQTEMVAGATDKVVEVSSDDLPGEPASDHPAAPSVSGPDPFNWSGQHNTDEVRSDPHALVQGLAIAKK